MMVSDDVSDRLEARRTAAQARLYRSRSEDFARWAAGYGVIRHGDEVQVKVLRMSEALVQRGRIDQQADVFRRLEAVDRVASAALWLVAHMTYARNVYLDGRDLGPDDFKRSPDGHTGGALNVALAYVGYMAANALCGLTRGWIMGQGHGVAGIDSVNVLLGNMTPAHAARYGLSDEGLTNLVRDFYSYEIRPDGRPASPLGSHVNAHTAGGVMEGGYLGFAELYYVHMPLPGERLVAFLSDGSFEEQRGSDWVPRWWRASDSGLVAPIMIANGRRIDQRTTMSQQGGVGWFFDHLRLQGFDPVHLDGRDPASYCWGVLDMEDRLSAFGEAFAAGEVRYPAPVPYGIAEVPKGYGFPGAGTNAAHNLPLGTNPASDAEARARFNDAARRLWVPLPELERAIELLSTHERQGRPREREHPFCRRAVRDLRLPEPLWRREPMDGAHSPMEGVDRHFADIVRANPHLRPRVGNPDEMRSNRMNATLDLLKHRVTAPEPGVAEAIDGGVITALNEEAVICAALANKGGINLAVSYEAFAVKMLGAIRQELIFARNQREAGIEPQWLSVPILASSHTWENGKNEQSHQDPTLAEALLGEMTDGSRVAFPADWNSAVACLDACLRTRGQLWTMVVPKREVPLRFDPDAAERLARDGAATVRAVGREPRLLLVACGAYQLSQALAASGRLEARGVDHNVVYLLEPGRFRYPRDERERIRIASPELCEALFPASAEARVFLVHTRPEPFLGAVRPLDTGPRRTAALGYINRGGTLDVRGMLFANRCTWAHALDAAAGAIGCEPEEFLDEAELAALRGETEPAAVLFDGRV